MRKKVKSRLVYFLALPLLLLIVSYVLFITFQFTLIANIREEFSQVNEQEPLAYGEVLFKTRSCVGCHSTVPGQQNIGPNLFGISERKSKVYIRESILSPNMVIANGFTADRMPEYGLILDADQIYALVMYLSSLKW